MTEQVFVCPNCQVKFKLKSEIVITKQAKLACPKCKKILFIKPAMKIADSTHKMEGTPSVNVFMKAYDTEIQNEIVEDFLKYYKTSEEAVVEPIALVADEPRAFRDYLQKWLESIGFRT